jgi:two-component system CheB/CheR fusion protein
MDMMQGSVEQFRKTLTNLTEVTKLQKENDQLTALVNLAEVIEEVRLDLIPLIQSTNSQIEVDVAADQTIFFAEKTYEA